MTLDGRDAGSSYRCEPPSTLVYLVRHGQTDFNRERRFQGQMDVPLSAAGLEQARATAEWLANEPVRFDAIYSSDLERASATARIIGEHLERGVILAPELREIDVGEWEGLTGAEIEERFPGQLELWHQLAEKFVLPSGESILRVQARVLEFYNSALAAHRGGTILIVSHGLALAALIAGLSGWGRIDVWDTNRARMGNAAITIVCSDLVGGRHEVLRFNITEHLSHPTGMGAILNSGDSETA